MTHCSHVLQCTVIQPVTDFHCAAEALEAWKKVENSIVSFTAVGISIDSEAASEASAACATAQALIVSLFPAGQSFLPCHLKPTQLCVTTYESVLIAMPTQLCHTHEKVRTFMPRVVRSKGGLGDACEPESMEGSGHDGVWAPVQC